MRKFIYPAVCCIVLGAVLGQQWAQGQNNRDACANAHGIYVLAINGFVCVRPEALIFSK